MPRRIAAALVDIGALTRRDPSSFVCAFAAWSFINGLSLLATRDPFHKSPIYRAVADINIDSNLVGLTMLIDGVLLLYSIIARTPVVRAGIAYLSGIVWFIWGCLLGLGAWNADLVSAASIWIVLSSFWLMRSITAHPPGAGAPRDSLHPAAPVSDVFPPIHIPDDEGL